MSLKKISQLSEESDCSSNSTACKFCIFSNENSQFLTYKEMCLYDFLHWHKSKIPSFLFFFNVPQTSAKWRDRISGVEGTLAAPWPDWPLCDYSSGRAESWIHVADSFVPQTLNTSVLDIALSAREIKMPLCLRNVRPWERNGKIIKPLRAMNREFFKRKR